MVQTLRAKHCDLIICLSHLGWKIEEVSDDDVIAAVEGIDLVLGGHSHSYFRQMQYVKDPAGREVPVDQNGKHAVYVGKIRVEMVPAKTKNKFKELILWKRTRQSWVTATSIRAQR